jgi:hypothetical protein
MLIYILLKCAQIATELHVILSVSCSIVYLTIFPGKLMCMELARKAADETRITISLKPF